MTSTIFLLLVGTCVVRVGVQMPSAYTNVPNWLVARDRCGLITGFAIAVTAFAIVSLPLPEVVIPQAIWFVGLGLLSSGVFGAVLRWPDLAWYRGTKPLQRMIGVIPTLCICLLIIGVAVI